ncbi:Methyltransferase-like protein 25 [Escovopsis weberi]|uniref:Methyltransferase-like protein 25 n=1 Tax=Escovopsis weberi TaxID=150374 RepID=A0A0M8N1Z1_ESCWE|nr:Methyltransferase-like protein 25 [Escovopsis weberi]
MIPHRELPCSEEFSSPEEYVEELLAFSRSTPLFQMLCGGVHILDFFTTEPGIFRAALPQEWHAFLLSYDIMKLLDLFLRDDLDDLEALGAHDGPPVPESLIAYARLLRRFSLRRDFAPGAGRQGCSKLPPLPRTVAVGMKPKKVHEVVHFADYVERLSGEVARATGRPISHFVDFGSGQNYLGRALASEPYNRHVVAVEGRENNVSAARWYDVKSGLAVRPRAMRNKKMWTRALETLGPEERKDPARVAAAVARVEGAEQYDFRPVNVADAEYPADSGNGVIQYIAGRLDSGDLSGVIAGIERGQGGGEGEGEDEEDEKEQALRLMAVSIHSCGNLSHFGIRSLVLNPDIRAVAIVGCCYNLMTERLGPPTYKHKHGSGDGHDDHEDGSGSGNAQEEEEGEEGEHRHTLLRASLQPLNGRVVRESERRDPEGFPMSARFCGYRGGMRLNITARMMACQAPDNWTCAESEGFFTRHFFRAVLQRIFLDRGVVSHVWHDGADATKTGTGTGTGTGTETRTRTRTPFNTSTNPVVIGSLRKRCYGSIKDYVRGAVEKLTTSTEFKQYAEVMRDKMGGITDEEIERYEAEYLPRRKELCVIWSLMALSARVVESLIVADRWAYLKEQAEVERAWVETVFDHGESPRNLVVVGIKKEERA